MKNLNIGGAEEDRTPDPLRARQVLSQLSYDPFFYFKLLLYSALRILPSLSHIPVYALSLARIRALIKAKSLVKMLRVTLLLPLALRACSFRVRASFAPFGA